MRTTSVLKQSCQMWVQRWESAVDSKQLITCWLWQPCSAALSFPRGQRFKLQVSFCSFLVFWCFSSLPCLVLLTGHRWGHTCVLGHSRVFCCGDFWWLEFIRACELTLVLVVELYWTDLALGPAAEDRLQVWHSLFHSVWWFKCCRPEEILHFCCAVD